MFSTLGPGPCPGKEDIAEDRDAAGDSGDAENQPETDATPPVPSDGGADATPPVPSDGGADAESPGASDAGSDAGIKENPPTEVFPGGFLEATTSAGIRPRLSASEIEALLPAAGGTFVFPSPYETEAVRLTDASSCAGGDCVWPVGYSYWRNINNHVDDAEMLIFLGLDPAAGGTGVTLFSYDKPSGTVTNLGSLFADTSIPEGLTGENLYFSATMPHALYVAQGSQLLRFDVIDKTTEVVLDVAPTYGADKYIWQHHSSDDDNVHSATLRESGTWATLGCVVYFEDTDDFSYFPAEGDFDECQIDRSGRWLVIKDNVDGANGEDNRIIDLDAGAETILLDEDGAAGHSDMGHGVMVAEDNWNGLPGAVRAWTLGEGSLLGPIVYHEPAWRFEGMSHISHTNARGDAPIGAQYGCQSTVSAGDYTRGSEIFCYRLDGSLDVLVVAPVMTDLGFSGGGDTYSKAPKGNLDVTGRYFIWTSNMASDRLDAFIVKIPSQLLTE